MVRSPVPGDNGRHHRKRELGNRVMMIPARLTGRQVVAARQQWWGVERNHRPRKHSRVWVAGTSHPVVSLVDLHGLGSALELRAQGLEEHLGGLPNKIGVRGGQR